MACQKTTGKNALKSDQWIESLWKTRPFFFPAFNLICKPRGLNDSPETLVIDCDFIRAFRFCFQWTKREEFIHRSRFTSPSLSLFFALFFYFLFLIPRSFKNSRDDKSQLMKFIAHSSGGFDWWHNFIRNLRVVEKLAARIYEPRCFCPLFHQPCTFDAARYIWSDGLKRARIFPIAMISSRQTVRLSPSRHIAHTFWKSSAIQICTDCNRLAVSWLGGQTYDNYQLLNRNQKIKYFSIIFDIWYLKYDLWNAISNVWWNGW